MYNIEYVGKYILFLLKKIFNNMMLDYELNVYCLNMYVLNFIGLLVFKFNNNNGILDD